MGYGTFICQRCGKTNEKLWSGLDTANQEQSALVCDDCYRKLIEVIEN